MQMRADLVKVRCHLRRTSRREATPLPGFRSSRVNQKRSRGDRVERRQLARPTRRHPRIAQGGMGVAISGWRLARAVASHRACMGVVSGTALDSVVARRLQDGDTGGHLRRAIEAFPDQGVAGRVLDRFFVPMGKKVGTPYRRVGMQTHVERPLVRDLTVLAAFVEVVLAREGHRGRVGINLLTKVKAPTLPTLYGAMLAGVDCILMGAGIPREIPGVLDAFAEGRGARLRLLDGPTTDELAPMLRFDPEGVGYGAAQLPRPAFLPIVSADSLAPGCGSNTSST